MIDADLLRELGWSNDLISAVTRAAEPLRATHEKLTNIGAPITVNSFVAGNAIYADHLLNSSTQEITIKLPN